MYNKYMRNRLPNLNKEEKEFWDKNKDFAVVYNKTQLAKLQDISYDKVTTKGTMSWLYEHCGIQPHEFLAKRVDSYSYDPTIEIRFNGADILAIYRLAI
jgi:hypothetical protein